MKSKFGERLINKIHVNRVNLEARLRVVEDVDIARALALALGYSDEEIRQALFDVRDEGK